MSDVFGQRKPRTIEEVRALLADLPPMPTAMALAALPDLARKHMEAVMERREELLTAWVAETGLLPSESVLCTQDSYEGDKLVTRCWVERR